MKKLLFISGFLLTILLFPKGLFAYVRIDTNDGYIEPNSYDISDVNSYWTSSSGSTFNSISPWLYSISNFIYLGQAKGSIINVNADFLFGISYNSNVVDVNTEYYNTSRNTLKASNLRCGIGDYQSGYYTGSSPSITNFNVSIVEKSVSSTRTQVLYRIRFDYQQEIQSVNLSSTNFSCWFVRDPSDGLFTQILNLDSSYSNFIYYYYSGGNYYFNVNVFDDPNTAILNNMTNQNNTIINQNTEINNSINDVNDSITNSNVDDPSSTIDSFNDKLANNGVITQLVTLPVTLFSNVLNSVTGTCSSYNLGSLLGTDLILPCINISNYIGATLWSVIDVLISGLFVYAISRKFIKVFENLSSMKEGDVISD